MGLFSRKKKKQQTAAVFAPPDPNTRIDMEPPAPDPDLMVLPDYNDPEMEITTEYNDIDIPCRSTIKGNWNEPEKARYDYRLMKKGDSQKSVEHWEDDAGNSSGWISTKERTSISVIEPCGFVGFDDVIIKNRDWFNPETGEIQEQDGLCIIPNDLQYQKIIKDWSSMSKWFDEEWNNDNEAINLIPVMKIMFLMNHLQEIALTDIQANSPYKNYSYDSYMIIEGLTPTGKVKKFPIYATIQITTWVKLENYNTYEEYEQAENSTLKQRCYLTAHYLKNGTIGKASIHYSEEKIGYNIDIASDSKTGNYYIKRIKKNDFTSGYQDSITIYPAY